MSKRAEKANLLHKSGYSCAQAVACAFDDVIGLSDKQIAALLSGFGGGFRTGEFCGVLSGAIMVLGAKWPHVEPEDNYTKQLAAKKAKEFQKRFTEKFELVRCDDIKKLPAKPEHSPTALEMGLQSACAVYIVAAVEIVEEMLAEE